MSDALLYIGPLMIALIMLGIPIAYAMVTTSVVYLLFFRTLTPLTIIPQTGVGIISESFTLLAVPLFLLAGDLMNESGMTRRLVGFALAIVGHIRGGLGHAVVVANVVMAGMSGSAAADAAGIGSMMIPALRKAGFSAERAATLCSASACIGPIIPPSIVMVLYSSFTGVSVGALFLAGFIPGLLMAAALMADIYFSKDSANTVREQFHWQKVRSSAKDAFLAIMLPLVILSGMFGGLYTPTEAAAVAVLYVLAIGSIVYRTLTVGRIVKTFRRVGTITGAVMIIVAAANTVSWIVNIERVGSGMMSLLGPFLTEPMALMAILIGIVLLLGCFLDTSAIVVIMPPIMAPIAVSAGIDPVHFGLLFCLATTIGMITPPVGISMFITSAIAEITTNQYSKAIVRPLIALFFAVVIMIMFPRSVTFLPNLVMGK